MPEDKSSTTTESKTSSKAAKEVAVDPITNQPVSDFFPAGLSEDHKDAVDVSMSALKGASGNARAALANELMQLREEQKNVDEQNTANVKSVQEETDRMFKAMGNIPPDLYAARERARVDAEAAALTTNKIRPGGVFKVGEQWVNANGEPTEAPEGEK